MRNQYLLGLGGALLAATSLSTAASAAIIAGTQVAAGVNLPTSAITSARIGAQLFGGTTGYTATTTIGRQTVFIGFTNTYNTALLPKIVLNIAGATFSSNSLNGQSNANLIVFSTTSGTATTITLTISGGSVGCNVGVLSTQIQITSCSTLGVTGGTSYGISGIELSGLIYTAATGLGTAGSTITLSGAVTEQANPTNTFETITSAAVVTSVNTASVSVLTAAGTANAAGTVAFSTLTQALGNAGTGLTFTLAEILITGTGAKLADLATTVTTAGAVGPLALTVTSAVLSDPAITNVRFQHDGTAPATLQTATTLAGTATFSNTNLTASALFDNGGTSLVQVEFNGTTGLTGGAAGTVAGTWTATGGNGVGLAALTGATSALTRAGFNVQVNSVQSSTNPTVQSYVRITNGSTTAGTAIITVYNGSTGAVLGTYTTASIAGLATLQLSAAQIETGASFAAVSGGSYNLVITGALPSGYVQHITGNPGNLFVDFSGRRSQAISGD